LLFDFLDLHSPAPFIEEMTFIQHQPVVVDTFLEFAQLGAGVRIVQRTAADVDAREKRRAVPVPSRAHEQEGDFTSVDFIADHVEIGRAQRRDTAAGNLHQHRECRERAELSELGSDPSIEIGGGMIFRNRRANSLRSRSRPREPTSGDDPLRWRCRCAMFASPMTSPPHSNETILDLRGLRCPQPVLRAKKALRNVPVGGTLVMECTDPLTVIDVPHFVNQTGHALSAQSRDGDLYIFKIVKRR
jgi:tRNA 2-thiouridine synthesizing protein A